MTWIAAAIATSAVVGGIASNKAAKTQLQAQREGEAAQERMFNRQVELQEPFRKAGVNALPELIAASRYTPFGMEQFQQDPGYAFRLREGLKALDQSAAARGGLLSGATLRGAQRYGQELGSQEYMNAFNRYQVERQARLNPLQSLAGMGQTTAATLGSQAGQYGQNLAEGAAMRGNIRASGYLGTANALASALGTGAGYLQDREMMRLYGPR